jgi:DNA-binding MarR family transcriptional regulator
MPCRAARTSTSSASSCPPVIAELVAHLERRGYVERVRDPADRRARPVRATAKGREVYAVARELTGEIEAELTAALGEQRVTTLRELLSELLSALQEA